MSKEAAASDCSPSHAASAAAPQRIIGIGASAGGVEAYQQLLRSLPSDTGFAFVLVQHLDPNHDSLMVELLSKQTSMPVVEITDGMTIEPNRVHMIPPNASLQIEKNRLSLDPPARKRGTRMPIDRFFHSLARAFGHRAIGVVLSGTGSDGAEGLREIRSRGGLAVVQQPETSAYDGMPRAAMTSNDVDLVAPIEQLADAILYRVADAGSTVGTQSDLHEMSEDYHVILSLLKGHYNHDFRHYKKGTLTRRIDRRMGLHGLSDPAAYVDLLRRDQQELQTLHKDLLIGVTRFFRDPAAWQKLSELLAETIRAKEDDDSFRVWVPGCASGEEAYSVGMLLLDLQDHHKRRLDVQIFGTDIDAEAIDQARNGLYSKGAGKDIGNDRLARFLQLDGNHLRIQKRLRECCIFAVQNLLADAPFSDVDLICCRNLLIYLEPVIQRRLFQLLHFALRPGGILMLGSSESPSHRESQFAMISQTSRIYRKVGHSRPDAPGFPVDKKSTLLAGMSESYFQLGEAKSIGTAELSKRSLLDAFAPASVVVNSQGRIQYIHGAVRGYLDFPTGEPDLELAGMLLPGLRPRVRSALQEARSRRETISTTAPRVTRGETELAVQIRIQPLPAGHETEPLFLISFVDEAAVPRVGSQPGQPLEHGGDDRLSAAGLSPDQLARELQATREDLQSTIEELESANEELKASNEEVMSMNEELQSTNEELETSREELHSLNEELTTVNGQLHDKVTELEATADDLANLLAGTDLAILFLDQELKIRRFTPATRRLMNIRDADAGRPVIDLASRVNDPDLVEDAHQVLDQLTPIEKEVRGGDQLWFLRRVMPFRTADNKIEGVVVTYSDISGLKRSAKQLESRERQQATIARLGQAALGGMPLEELLERATRDVAETLQADYCKILQIEPERKHLRLVAGVGWKAGLVGRATVPSSLDSQAGYTLQSGGPVVVCDLDKEKRFSGPQLLHDHQIASGISVIIGPRDDPWGLLSVHSRVPIDYTLDDAHFATAVANVLGDAIRRRDIESQLRDSEARTAAFLNNSAVVCWMKDEQGRYVYLNENYQKRFHVRLEDWRDKTDWEVWPADVAEGLRSNDRKCLESGKPLEVIEEVVDAAGKSSHFLTAKFPFIDAGGNRYVGGLGVDVTATVEAEEALAKSEEHLRTAAAMAGFGTYFGDLDTGELTWSAELKSIFGLAPDAPTPCGIGEVPELVYPGDRARVLEKVRASLDPAGNGDFHDEHRIVRPDGEVRWLLLQGRTIFQEDARGRRRPIKIAGIGQDITERHQFEAELEHARQSAEAANRAKSMFLANVSHEIRSPMTAILGYAEILQSQLEDEDARRCLKTIRDSGTYLCDILDDILDLAKIEAGKTTVNREAVDTAEMLADVRSLMSVRALEKDLALTVRFIGQVPATICTDRQRVRQVLVNLIGNAIKFTERGSVEITMTCHAADELLEIAVIDSGVGIEADQIDLLFQPFERLEGAAANNVGGSGLGLSISKKLLEMLGGQITASSVPGEGSTFRFTLPTGPLDDVRWISPAPDALREERGEVTPEQLPQLHARVLAVDDRPEIRFLLRHFSERAGADVKTAENGLEALEVFRSCRDANAPPDVILMDMQMPEMDGMEATRRLRDEGYQGPIIAITASAMESDRQKCLQTGCNDFLSKPVERAELIRKLASWSGKGSNQ